MAATPRKSTTFTVSGPGVDRNGYDTGGIGLSAAITFASRATGEATYYVRDPDGNIFGHAERVEDGVVRITRTGGDR